MSAVGLGALLLVVWVLLWDSITAANLLSGLAVVALVLWALQDVPLHVRRPTLRPVPFARFVARLGRDLVQANLIVTRDILSRRSAINTGVVAVPVPLCSDGLLTLIANVLCLSPGTMPIEVTRDPPVIYVHVLHLHDVESVRRDIQSLSVLAIRAFGSRSAIAVLDDADRRGPTPPTERLVDGDTGEVR